MIGCSFLINPIILHVLIKMHWICSSKLNFGSKNKPKCFWSWTWWTGLSLKFNDGYDLELVFWLNSKSWACLLGSRIKFIFHCTAHSEIFIRSLFRLTVLLVISCMVENSVVSKNFRIRLQTVRQVAYVNKKQ